MAKAKKKTYKKTKTKPKKKAVSKKKVLKISPKMILLRGCKLWDLTTTKAFEGDYAMPPEIAKFTDPYSSKKKPIPLYASHDYRALECRIVDDNNAEVTVGSSEGHRTHIDLAKKTVTYYDGNYTRKKLMVKLFKVVGLKCTLGEHGSPVLCKGVTPSKINNVYRVLTMPTSGDYRMSYCEGQTGSIDDCMKAEIKYFKAGPLHTVLGGK